jgi:tetratricopeptide (TPR) repeat protein
MSRRARTSKGARPSSTAVKGAAANRPTANRVDPALLTAAVGHHRAGRLAEAEALYERILALSPRQPDALHLLGLAAHQRGDHARAEALIQSAIAIHPDAAAYHNSLGTVLLARGQPAAAIESFRCALELNPNYAEAHNNLGNAYQKLGQTAGDLDAAIASYRRALACRPDYAEAHSNLGRALHTAGDLDAAITSYRRALGHRPGYVNARKNLADALGELGRTGEAETHYRKALESDPGNADAHAGLAALCERASRLDEALDEAKAALTSEPRHVRATVMAARCERRLGRCEAGRTRLAAITGPAVYDGLDDASRASIAFEMAMTLDRLGDYRAAFRWFGEGNRMIMQSPQARRIDFAAFPRAVDRLMMRFSREWMATWTPPVPYDPAPVFLIGFPRSGTTLLDQVLNAHPALVTLEEKPVLDAVKRALEERPDGYPEALATLAEDEIAALRDIYFAELAKHLPEGPTPRSPAALVIDKMPLNAIDAGLIYRLFPEAKTILALRHPCDVVLSGFMQAFRPNAAMVRFSTLEGTAALYAQVMALWRRYAEILPLSALATRYEDLVADFPAETRRILDFLGLPWDDAVLSYRERAKTRAIATPSYHQVVQPIYARSVGRWRNYTEEMAPVLPVLRPFITAFGYSSEEERAPEEED